MFDAIDPLKFARTKALQQSVSRLAPPNLAFGNAAALPRLKNGPDSDQFVNTAKLNANASQPTVAKSGPAAFLQNLKGLVAKVSQPTKVQGAPKLEQSTMADVAQRPAVPIQFAGGKKLETPEKSFDKAAENVASASSGVTANRFSDFNAKLQQQKKTITGVSAALPLFGMAVLSLPVLGPTAMVAKPALINQVVAALPTTFS